MNMSDRFLLHALRGYTATTPYCRLSTYSTMEREFWILCLVLGRYLKEATPLVGEPKEGE